MPGAAASILHVPAHFTFTKPHEVPDVIILILQLRKLRQTEVKALA